MHYTEFTDVSAQLVTINGKIYVGLQRKSYSEDKNNPRLKSILLLIEARTTFVTQAIPTLDKAIKEQQAKEPPAPPEKAYSRKRPYFSGMLTLPFTLQEKHFQNLTLNHIETQVAFYFCFIGGAQQHTRRGMAGGIRGVFRKPS